MNYVVNARQQINGDIFYSEYLQSIKELCKILDDEKQW